MPEKINGFLRTETHVPNKAEMEEMNKPRRRGSSESSIFGRGYDEPRKQDYHEEIKGFAYSDENPPKPALPPTPTEPPLSPEQLKSSEESRLYLEKMKQDHQNRLAELTTAYEESINAPGITEDQHSQLLDKYGKEYREQENIYKYGVPYPLDITLW